ncbi:MAG: c-type cytochrome biogenesis protein CcsB [Actinomycetota bacterium]|nr:c-type cytochrome biogenesis protein CcsB [Actinomycetota bacterium]
MTGLADLSYALVLSAMAVYACAMLAFASSVAMAPRAVAPAAPGGSAGAVLEAEREPEPDGRSDRLTRIGVSLLGLAFLLHLGAVGSRALAVGRAPWGNLYEFVLTMALAAAGAYLLLLLRGHSVAFLGVVVAPSVLLALGVCITVLYVQPGDLVPALKSYWLIIHVAVAIVSSGALYAGAALSVLVLLRDRLAGDGAADRRAVRRWVAQLPDTASLNRLAHRVHTFAFPLWTFAVISGAIWAERAWGRYWGWDAKEVWAFVTWVVYAAYLHAQSTAGWRGRPAAVLALVGFACFLFNLLGVNFLFTSFHTYAGLE